MIKRIKSLIKKVAGIKKVVKEPIQKQLSEPHQQDFKTSNYTTVPAPVYLKQDSWFDSEPVISEKQRDYMEQETIVKMQEEMQNTEVTRESNDIHAKMYEIATKNWNTVAETQGGSENFHEGPGGWSSGSGQNKL